MWDLRAKQFFKSEDDFHRGMKLLVQYLSATTAGQSFEEVSKEFLDQLDDTTDSESLLLTSAAQYQASKQIDVGQRPYDLLSTHYDKEILKIGALVNEKILSLMPQQNIQSIPLSEAFDKFIATHRSGWKATGGMEQSYRKTMFPFLISIVGDIPTCDLKKINITELVEILHVYPANKNKKIEYQYLSESPRILRRLQTLRRWSHEQEIKPFFTRDARTRCSDGARAPRGVPIPVGLH